MKKRPLLLELRSLKIVPVSQNESVSSTNRNLIGRRACGIACIAMVLKFFDKYPKDQNLRNIEWLILEISKLHKNGVSNLKQKITLDNQVHWITVDTAGENTDVSTNQRIFKPDSSYFPSFSLVRGLDHRASSEIFGKYNLTAGMFESISIDEVKKMLTDDKFVILSIKPKRKIAQKITGEDAFEGHLVLITDYDSFGDTFYVVDPDFDLKLRLLPKYEIRARDLAKISNYKGTWVKGNK